MGKMQRGFESFLLKSTKLLFDSMMSKQKDAYAGVIEVMQLKSTKEGPGLPRAGEAYVDHDQDRALLRRVGEQHAEQLRGSDARRARHVRRHREHEGRRLPGSPGQVAPLQHRLHQHRVLEAGRGKHKLRARHRELAVQRHAALLNHQLLKHSGETLVIHHAALLRFSAKLKDEMPKVGVILMLVPTSSSTPGDS